MNTQSSDDRLERVSPALRRFITNFAVHRRPIFEVVLRAARDTPAGGRLLDIGAGDSPYRELFTHLDYRTNDWENSLFEEARVVDFPGPAHEIPVDDGQFDAVLSTQMLEHVPNPQEVIDESFRILKPGGHLHMTVPFIWCLHEIPFDYLRYTPSILETMLTTAGFTQLDIRGFSDSFSTFAELLRTVPQMIGTYPDGRDAERQQAAATLRSAADQFEKLGHLDAQWRFPLGYSVRAMKPDPAAEPTGAPDEAGRGSLRAAIGLGQARRFVTLCFAVDVLFEPDLLTRYAHHFSDEDDATLVIYAPRVDIDLAARTLAHLVRSLGLDGTEAPAMIALPTHGTSDEPRLAAAVDAVYSARPPWAAFAGLPWCHRGRLEDLRARFEAT
jgi:SAM-dependent methyltransferase